MAANANTQPIFVGSIKNSDVKLTPSIGIGQDLDGTNAIELYAAGSLGSRVEKITIKHTANNVSDSVIRILKDSGTGVYLYREITLPALPVLLNTYENPGVTVKPADGFINLASGERLLVISTLAVTIDVMAFGGDF